ncbi:MAG: FAD-binding oxidoreductase [Dokdonella sp.]
MQTTHAPSAGVSQLRPGQQQSALVVGAGVVGLACALRLRQQGLRTTLVDPLAAPASASCGNAGHIAVEQVEPLASWATLRAAPRRLFAFGGALDVRDLAEFLPWMLRFVRAASAANLRSGRCGLRALLNLALPAWRALLDDIGRPDLLHADGHVALWESARSARSRRRAWMAADIGSARVHELDSADLDAYAGLLSRRPIGGVRFTGTGQVADVAQTLQALRSAFDLAGGHFVCAQARSLRIDDNIARVVLDDGRQLDADVVLVAAGIGSRGLMQSSGQRTPLIAERGYHVQWSEHAWPADRSPVVFEDRSIIVTRFRGGLRVAGFTEFAKPQTRPDPRKWYAIRAHAAQVGLPTSGHGEEWMGARPTLPDYLPAIGRSTAASNLLYAFGHQHLGLTLAPITAELIVALAGGDAPPFPLAPFDLQRFHHGTGVSHA